MQDCSLRFGHVTEYDPSRHMARVNFPDMGLVSYWLPVLVPNALKNHDEHGLDIGEHVACLMSGIGAEMGVVLGAFYDDTNKPPVQDEEIRSVTFSDGVRVMYDRESHTLAIDSPELVYISAARIAVLSNDITITGKINLNGTTTLSGNITLSGSVSCPGYCRCG